MEGQAIASLYSLTYAQKQAEIEAEEGTVALYTGRKLTGKKIAGSRVSLYPGWVSLLIKVASVIRLS